MRNDINQDTKIIKTDRTTFLVLDVCINNSADFRTSAVYRFHELPQTKFVLSFRKFLIKNKCKKLCIVGDFNIENRNVRSRCIIGDFNIENRNARSRFIFGDFNIEKRNARSRCIIGDFNIDITYGDS